MAGTKKDNNKEYSSNWGGKRKGQGRPKGTKGPYKEVTLNCKVMIRFTEEEKNLLEERASEAGLSVSKYIHNLVFPEN